MSLDEKIKQLTELSKKHSDGHFTIMKFTTNYRVCFYTPSNQDDIQLMPVGNTLEEAIDNAINNAY